MSKLAVSLLVAALASSCALDMPFDGPGMERGRLRAPRDGDYVASTTVISVADTDEASAAFSRHMDVMMAALPQAPGLIGYSFSLVPFSNKENRTLAVWESEEAMLDWVISDAHATAMADFAEHGYAAAGSTTTWTLTAAQIPPTWAEAKERLSKDGRPAY